MTPPAGQSGLVARVGGRVLPVIRYVGGLSLLLGLTLRWTGPALFKSKRGSGRRAVTYQCVRVGVNSLGIVCLVQLFMGVILALQLAPALETYHSSDKIANIIGIGGFRMLGPIITAVVLSGFAGASIAAELGTMVVSEEIEALEAHALNPVRFLVVPRVLATLLMMMLLTIIADWMIAVGGYITSYLVLGTDVWVPYWANMQSQVRVRDFASGMIMAAVFGVLISLIACFEGLRVSGGAEGVGRATTMTVVYSIVNIIAAACVFTTVFYVFKF